MRSRLIAVMFLASLSTLATAGAAHAAFPGANGKIAFTRFVTGTGNAVWTMNPDGTQQTVVAVPPPQQGGTRWDNEFPAWSPNGQKIAFTQFFSNGITDEEGSDIFVMNADGTGQTNITNSPLLFNSDPSWSPDGQKIAFQRGGGPDVWTMNADGTGATRLTTVNDAGQPTWSPDGTKIAFRQSINSTTSSDIYLMNPNGTGQTQLTNEPGHDTWPNWSPSGNKIAFTRLFFLSPGVYERNVWVMNTDGSAQTNVTNLSDCNQNPCDTQGPAWSPDGKKIAFGEGGIHVMNGDGSGQALITGGGYPDWQPLPTAAYHHPQSASQLNVSIVPAFRQCGTGGNPVNSKHAPSLALDSCNPPKPGSVLAAVGITSQSSAQMTVVPGDTDPTNGNQANVSIMASLTDIQSTAGGDYNPNPSGADLTAVTRLRFTDKANGYGGLSATATEYDFRVPIDCSSTPDPSVGSSCSANTTANALVPGLIQEQRRMIAQAFRVRVDDSGANGIRGDNDDRIFATQGVFIP